MDLSRCLCAQLARQLDFQKDFQFVGVELVDEISEFGGIHLAHQG